MREREESFSEYGEFFYLNYISAEMQMNKFKK